MVSKTKSRVFQTAIYTALLAMFWCDGIVSAQIVQKTEVGEQGSVTVYQMTLHAAPEPTPAFRYRLSVLPHATIPGNAATHYLRSFGERGLDLPSEQATELLGRHYSEFNDLSIPISELPMESLSKAAALFDSYVDGHIQRASRCRYCDWGLAEEELVGMESLEFLLPSVQQTRTISRVLALRTRLAIARGEYENAIDHLRMNYQLAQDVSKMKFLVCDLVGMAEVGIANRGMLDLIAANDSPNMYWALAELPRPIVSVRESMRLEMSLGQRLLPALATADTAEHTEEEWSRLYRESVESLGKLVELTGGNRNVPFDSAALTTGMAITQYPSAKKLLIESGMDPEAVEEMAVGKVLLIAAAKEYQTIAQETEKAVYLPFSQSHEIVERSERQLNVRSMSLGKILAYQLLPALFQVRAAQYRVHRELNALQLIESLRHHASIHNEFPKSLADLELPAPRNPTTDRPFEYRLDGETAVLTLPESDRIPAQSARYELTLKKKK